MYGKIEEDEKVEGQDSKAQDEDGKNQGEDGKSQHEDKAAEANDIEAEIRREVEDLKTSKGRGEAFTGIRLDVQCGKLYQPITVFIIVTIISSVMSVYVMSTQDTGS